MACRESSHQPRAHTNAPPLANRYCRESTLFFNIAIPHVNGTLSFKYDIAKVVYFSCPKGQMAGKWNIDMESHRERDIC